MRRADIPIPKPAIIEEWDIIGIVDCAQAPPSLEMANESGKVRHMYSLRCRNVNEEHIVEMRVSLVVYVGSVPTVPGPSVVIEI